MDPEKLIEILDLRPLPQEGGYYRETYRAPLVVAGDALPDSYVGDRDASTAIYYLITAEENSALHVLPTDEVFHFYAGDAVMMLQLHPDGRSESHMLGSFLTAGERPQVVVPGGVWQGCRLTEGGSYALLGCTVAPGFDYRDFRLATPSNIDYLVTRYPTQADEIRRLAPRQP